MKSKERMKRVNRARKNRERVVKMANKVRRNRITKYLKLYGIKFTPKNSTDQLARKLTAWCKERKQPVPC